MRSDASSASGLFRVSPCAEDVAEPGCPASPLELAEMVLCPLVATVAESRVAAAGTTTSDRDAAPWRT